MRILVVEDDPGVGELVRDDLTEQGHAVDWVTNGNEALGLIEGFPYDLVVLDVMLPGENGFQIAQQVRQDDNPVPILMLTDLDAIDDRVEGLTLGADDYLVKPFHLRELRARVLALLRRAHQESSNRVQVGGLQVDLGEKRVWHHGQEVRLSGREFALLEFLVLHPGGHFPRERLLEHVWPGTASIDPRTVDTYIRYLRRKLGDDVIETVRGLGYRLVG